MEVAERQVLQFAVGLVQAQAVGDGRINFQRLGCNAAPFAARHVRQRAHIVRAVGQLDEDDAHIAGHGQQHLAKRFSLVFLAGIELQLVQLGQSVDQLGHRQAEALGQIVLGDAAVFHGIVHQRRHQRRRIELP
ncbi:hypothetical protein D3C78_1420680 [compost metagenome]